MKRSTDSVKYFFSILLMYSLCIPCLAQEIQVHGGFLSDSIKVGELTQYYLTVRYPSKLNVLFPDSTYDFKPFEFEKQYYVATKTKDSISYDSVVYYLSTFEVDAIQSLSLPVFVVSKKDSVPFDASRDSLALIQTVHHVPDSLSADKLPLKTSTAYQPVSHLFNYPVLLLMGGILLVASLVAGLVFGKRIRTYFKIRKLTRNHQKFLELYRSRLASVKEKRSPVISESILTTWKKYMEQLEAKPYTKLTTREMLLLDKDENLSRDLRAIDKAIYGNGADVLQPLENLRDYATQKFLRKIEEVKHG